LDCLIETKIHNTASFYPQNRGPGSLRQKQGTTCVLILIVDDWVEKSILKELQIRKNQVFSRKRKMFSACVHGEAVRVCWSRHRRRNLWNEQEMTQVFP
jgi:hypothetical protein